MIIFGMAGLKDGTKKPIRVAGYQGAEDLALARTVAMATQNVKTVLFLVPPIVNILTGEN